MRKKKTMYVKAAKLGTKVPREEHSYRYIEDEAIEVPSTIYYRRRVLHGELVEVDSGGNQKPLTTEAATAPAAATTTEGSAATDASASTPPPIPSASKKKFTSKEA